MLLEVRQGSLSATAAALQTSVTINVAQERGVLTVLAPQTLPVVAAGPQTQVPRKAPLAAVYVKVFARTPQGCLLYTSDAADE